MVVEITEATLKRLINYAAVVEQEHREAAKHQWRVMTLEVLQAAERTGARARHIQAVVAYAGYLFRLQWGREQPRSIYGEPLLSLGLCELMQELSIASRLVPVAKIAAS